MIPATGYLRAVGCILFVRGAFGTPKMRQRRALQIRGGPARPRKPIIGGGTRDAGESGHEIGGSEAGKLFSECHHGQPTPQRKIRNAENSSCTCPHCGHNDSTMNLNELINDHNKRIKAHHDHGEIVDCMYAARQKAAKGLKPSKVSADAYQREWQAYNEEQDRIRRIDLEPLFLAASQAGMSIRRLTGGFLALA